MALAPSTFDGSTFFNDSEDGIVTTNTRVTATIGGNPVDGGRVAQALAYPAGVFGPAAANNALATAVRANVQLMVGMTNYAAQIPLNNLVGAYAAHVRVEKSGGNYYARLVVLKYANNTFDCATSATTILQ